MKHFIFFLINIITVAALAHPVIAQDPKDAERTAEITRNWGDEYDAASAQPVTIRGAKETGRIEIIRNWGGEYD